MFEFLLPKRRRKTAERRKATAPQLCHLPGESLEFLFQRDHCRTLRLTIKPNGSIRVKAPASVPMETVLDFVRSRLPWIREKQRVFQEHHRAAPAIGDGAEIRYLGRPYTIRTIPRSRKAKASLIGDQLVLPCRSQDDADVENAFKDWRLALAKDILARRLARLDTRARHVFGDDIRPAILTVRSLKRRWGSCSARGQMTLAAQLIELPLPLVDYVICHELCHLRRMDHSPAFHALLHRLLPDARDREKAIRLWSLRFPRS